MVDVYCTSSEVGRSGVSTAIVPIGSIEQHSLHLPLGTDWILADEVGRRVAAKLHAYLLPALPFSCSLEHSSCPGTVSLGLSTFIQVIRDVALSLHSQGISHIAFLSWHGGNWGLKPAVRELNLLNPGLHAIWAVPWELAQSQLRTVFPHYDQDIHAGDVETSCMLHLMSTVVLPERVDFVPPVGREYFDYVPFARLSPTGVWGHPSLASTEKGEKALSVIVETTAAYVRESFSSIQGFDSAGVR